MAAPDARIEIEIHDCEGGKTSLKMAQLDSLVIGRGRDCDQVVAGDRALSRHHFLLEINVADVTIRDIGSRNGTFVNGQKLAVADSSEDSSSWLQLGNGDKVEAGRTTFIIHLRTIPRCTECGKRIPAGDRADALQKGGSFCCSRCRHDLGVQPRPRRRQRASAAAAIQRPACRPVPRQANDDAQGMSQSPERTPAEVVDDLLKNVLNIDGGGGGMPTIGGYRDLRLLGTGAFGAVYKAARISDGRTVALKTMLQTPPTQNEK